MQHSVADHPPTAPVHSFVDDVERLLDAHARDHDPDLIVQAVQRRLTALLASEGVLEPADRIPWADHYRPHLLTVAPSRRFSVMALIWAPEQVTPIHDHICWCVVGVLEGLEREQRFSLRQNDDGQRWLAPTTDVMVNPGEISRLTPPEENIHQVRNAGDALAISLHIYGADISVCGSSVNQCFDDLPIRADTAATPQTFVSWRGS
ncbi:MAG TPA: cysteine dioxygenase family protein [Ktedonobacterales bacterium]|nr:cysteine dioxygenase family protein [Ktedonobacterales bacterium]HEX5571233.1 cysteine dioxygenase family protein [Ktedonobacterales bacterium]